MLEMKLECVTTIYGETLCKLGRGKGASLEHMQEFEHCWNDRRGEYLLEILAS